MKKNSKPRWEKGDKRASEAASKRNSQNSAYRNRNSARIEKAKWLKANAKAKGETATTPYWELEGSLGLYIREIRDLPRLKLKEERELFKNFIKWRDTRASKTHCNGRIRKIGREAREKLITSNLLLVVKIAGDYRSCGVPMEDLVNEGNMGLMRAVEKFELGRGTKLSTYASYWIRNAILRLLAHDARVIALPESARDAYYRIVKFREKFAQAHNREPSKKEIAKGAKCAESMVENVFESGVMNIVSLNGTPISEDSDEELQSIIPDLNAMSPDEEKLYSEDMKTLVKFLQTLSKQERKVLIYRYGLNNKESETLEKVGERYGVTRERIRQIQELAMEKLKSLSSRYYNYNIALPKKD